jgi:hypothetical protein
MEGVAVSVEEDTAYPFSDKITFVMTVGNPVRFPLTIRVPEWAGSVRLTAPGAEVVAGDGIRTVTKTWQTGDRVTVEFENPITARDLPNGEVSINRGPLLFVRSWPSKLVPLTTQEFLVPGFSEYNVLPVTAYDATGLFVDREAKDCGFALHRNPKGSEADPWSNPPIELTGEMRIAKRNKDFHADVTLVPMGTTLLRFAGFQVWPFDDRYFESRADKPSH